MGGVELALTLLFG